MTPEVVYSLFNSVVNPNPFRLGGYGAGSVTSRNESADTDPDQNETDPQH